ncbi:MAG TPA: hypothetical protein VKA65_00170, partial [Acidimicrobiales bacterium]|nr:hypothetical protein [Acidimicrobiales bacterium]
MSRAHPRRRRPRFAAFALAGVAGSLAVTSPAWAAPGIDPGSGAYWNTDPTYQITGGAAENLTWAATGPGGFAAGGTLVGGGPVSLAGFPEGGGTLTAFPTENPADAASVAFTKDVTPPAVSLALTGTASPSGWYRSPLTITPTCSDLAPIVAGCTAIPWTTDGANRTATITATDAAGNVGTNSVTFNYDNTLPLASDGLPSQPAPAALVAAEPQFSWTPGVDAVSGVDRYQLQFRNVTEGTGYETIAVVNHTGGVGDYSARRDPALRAAPLPQQDQLQWRVVTIDKAGNARDSAPRGLTIDSSIPPAPVITGGPSTPIRFTSPTFSWTGTQETYLWDLTIPGREAPVRSGGGLAKEVTLQSLADGPYTFRVSQVTPFGQPSAQATRAFVVDTTPPAAPEITVRPPFPASG